MTTPGSGRGWPLSTWRLSPPYVRVWVLLLVVASHPAWPVVGEEPRGVLALPLKVKSWRVEDGIPLAPTLMIAQDHAGFLWLAGEHEGLYRFDGKTFTPTGTDFYSPVAYPGRRDITSLAAGGSGLWLGTFNSGLWRFLDGQWKQFTTADGLCDDHVTALALDAHGDLWVGTSSGLNRLHGLTITAYRVAEGIPSACITSIVRDRKGTVWVGTRDGDLLKKRADRFEVVPRLPGWGPDQILAMLETRDGAVWVGPWCGGLARFQDDDVRVYGRDDGLDDNQVIALEEDRWGSAWIGARGGLFILKKSSKTARGVVRRVNSELTSSLFRDREGTIWAGTPTCLHEYHDWRLRVFGEHQGLTDRDIVSVEPAQGGGVWASLDSRGIVKLKDGKVAERIDRTRGLTYNSATTLCQSRDGTPWLGTWGHGVNRLVNGQVIPFPQYGVNAHDIVRSIIEDRAGDFWVGTWGKGLRRYHDGKATTFTTADGLADDRVRVLEQDDDGIWIATDGGLNRFAGGRLTQFTTREGLSENSIFALHKGSDGSLWIGTWGGGLDRIKDGRISVYTTRDGLPCDTICSILEDGQGGLWFGSVSGVFRVRLTEFDLLDRGAIGALGVLPLGESEGMLSAECNRGTQPSACRTGDGMLWFATTRGLVMIDPERLPEPPPPPRTFVLAIEEQQQHPLDKVAAANLTHGQRELTFRYTTSSLVAPEKVRFQYKLDGFNSDWIEAGTERLARFSNLPAGRFQFQARARQGDGVWGPVAMAFPLEIAPAVYQTTWFRVLVVCLGLGVVAIGVRLRVIRLIAHERMLEALVEERTALARAAQEAAEQASSAKDHFLAVLSHELRTPLTPVLLSVGCLLEDTDDPELREQLEMIMRNIQLEARLVDDLLDLSRIELGSLHLDIKVVDVHEAIDRAIGVCHGEVDSARLILSTSLRAKTHHVRADFARLMQLFWNLIRNSVKFTPPGGRITITSQSMGAIDDGSSPLLVVEFRDTGIGIEPHLLERIFDPFEQADPTGRGRRAGLGLGLAISRWVAESIGGRLTALSPGVGQGATFRLELPAFISLEQSSEDSSSRETLESPTALDILVVEDNLDTLRYLKIVLERFGHRVVAAASLAEARQASITGVFDLLLCDIQLPDGSGISLMREFGVSRRLVGIALSGFGTEDDLAESRRAGFSLHLVKPIVADELEQALRSLTPLLRSDRVTELTDA